MLHIDLGYLIATIFIVGVTLFFVFDSQDLDTQIRALGIGWGSGFAIIGLILSFKNHIIKEWLNNGTSPPNNRRTD